MARSRLDTLIYATILLAPLATALVYMTTRPEPATVVVAAAPAPVLVEAPVLVAPVVVAPVAAPEPVVTAPADPEPVPGASMLVYDGKLVLSTQADIAWARGRLQFDELDEPQHVTAWKAVAPGRLPAPLRSLAGAAVQVYAADGSPCAATVGAMTVYGRESGDLFESKEDQSEPTEAERLVVRKQVFAGARLLLAEIDGTCDGLWARRAELPAPAVFAAASLADAEQAALREQVLAALASHPDLIAMRGEYDAFVARQDPADTHRPWDTYLGETLSVQRFAEVGGAGSLLNVIVGDGGEECGDYFTTRVALLFKLADGRAELLGDGFLDPQVIVDLERDGTYDAVTEEGRAFAGDEFSFPLHGCRC